MKKNTTIMILTGSKTPSDLASIFGELPSALVPVNNRPAIFWTMEKFINDGFNKFIVCVGFKEEKVKYFVENNFSKRASIKFVKVDPKKKPGASLITGLKYVKTNNLLIILGDTLIYGKINLQNDFILTSNDFRREESYRWALALDGKGFLKDTFDKTKFISNKINNEKLKLIIGVYFFTNVLLLKTISKNLKKNNIEISEILKSYNRKKPMKLIDYKYWFDFGHLDKYYSSEKKFLQYQSRYFNFLKYDDILGTITKKSRDTIKFNNEIKWYLSVPKKIKVLAPRVIDYKIGKKPFLTLEYYGYPTLSELYVFGDLHNYIWKNIIDRTMKILNLFYKQKGNVKKEEYLEIYWEKLENRINRLLRENSEFRKIFQYEAIIINDKKYINFNALKKPLFSQIRKLYSKKDNCFIHGDFCFSNILYDPKNGILRIIDPRGLWAKSHFGDIKYDVAKLRHSIVGQYDFIINNLFNIQLKENIIKYQIFSNKKYLFLSRYFDSKIERFWSLEKIKLIEGLLFLSMLPLHKDYFKRQLVMYSIGIKNLNEVLVKK
ncbi:hypothetical protein DRN69_00795 [Candidatus Pacearchaeota archaeon]|nr:MAG: hypothetical protein DRN69_00795 [Candidatus Pacearchaeota archaeon]